MKRFLAMLLCLVTACLFVGCIPIKFDYDVVTEAEDITSIEVYYFEDNIYWNYNTRSWEYRIWNEETEKDDIIPYEGEPIAYIDAENYAALVEDVEAMPHIFGLPIIPMAIDPAWFFYGYVIKINSETDCELIHRSAGGSVYYFEEEDWNAFIKKYIGEELFMQIEQATQSSGDLV